MALPSRHIWTEHFNVGWFLRVVQGITGRLNTTLSFWVVTIVYVPSGLLEVDEARAKVGALDESENGSRRAARGSAAAGVKFRRYMLVRNTHERSHRRPGLGDGRPDRPTARAEWGVIAFALKYIPFVRTADRDRVADALRVGALFETWQAR